MLLTAAVPVLALAWGAEDLKNDHQTPGGVLTYGMGYAHHRFSPLTRINRDKDGILYLTDHEKAVALDALSGREIWKAMLESPEDTMRVLNTRELLQWIKDMSVCRRYALS